MGDLFFDNGIYCVGIIQNLCTFSFSGKPFFLRISLNLQAKGLGAWDRCCSACGTRNRPPSAGSFRKHPSARHILFGTLSSSFSSPVKSMQGEQRSRKPSALALLQIKNDGLMNRYLYTGTHEAIISDKMFMAVRQEELRRTKSLPSPSGSSSPGGADAPDPLGAGSPGRGSCC